MSNKIKKMSKSNHPNDRIDDKTAKMIDEISKSIEEHLDDIFFMFQNNDTEFINELNDILENVELACDTIGDTIHIQLAKLIGNENSLLVLNGLIRVTSAASMARQLQFLYSERVKNN